MLQKLGQKRDTIIMKASVEEAQQVLNGIHQDLQNEQIRPATNDVTSIQRIN